MTQDRPRTIWGIYMSYRRFQTWKTWNAKLYEGKPSPQNQEAPLSSSTPELPSHGQETRAGKTGLSK